MHHVIDVITYTYYTVLHAAHHITCITCPLHACNVHVMILHAWNVHAMIWSYHVIM